MNQTISNEEFHAVLKQLPKPHYPFPDFIHPDFQQQREEYYTWIDTEYIIHSKEAREKHLAPFPPSSPCVALFKDGELVHMLERHHIEGNPAGAIAANLQAAFDEYC
jgi:hypothetical protein